MCRCDAVLTGAAKLAAADCGMTAEQLIAHVLLGDLRHPSAAGAHCGATDPRDDRKWCAEDRGHAGPHNCYRDDDTIATYRARFGLPARPGHDESTPPPK